MDCEEDTDLLRLHAIFGDICQQDAAQAPKLDNELAQKILFEYANAPSVGEALPVAQALLCQARIRVLHSTSFNRLRKKRWCKAGLVLLVDDAAPREDDQDDLRNYFEPLPKGVYARWSGYAKTDRKNLTWGIGKECEVELLDEVWKSRLTRHSAERIGYALACLVLRAQPFVVCPRHSL